jgi:RHS repeat-associated protein
MPGRNFMGMEYRYGFNGMEKDNEVKGTGNSYTTTFRQFDPRLGQWLSVDPLFRKFPWQSPYVAFDNNPILKNDPNGDAPGEKRLGPNQSASGAESTGNHTSNTVNSTTTTRTNSEISVTNTESQRYGGTNSTTSTLSGSTSNVNNVSNKSAEVIAESMRASDIPEVKITSTQRNPEQQASAMYDNALNKGVESQYELYGSSGDKVIDTYTMYSPQWCCSKSEAVTAMSAKIRLIGAGNVSNHAADPLKLNVIDLSTKSLGGNAKPFHLSLSKNLGVSKLLTPFNSTDPAFHIEIPQ